MEKLEKSFEQLKEQQLQNWKQSLESFVVETDDDYIEYIELLEKTL